MEHYSKSYIIISYILLVFYNVNSTITISRDNYFNQTLKGLIRTYFEFIQFLITSIYWSFGSVDLFGVQYKYEIIFFVFLDI